MSKRLFVSSQPPRGLPPRIYLPVVLLVGAIFLAIMGYLLVQGFGSTGSVFGKAAKPGSEAMQQQGSPSNVEGGPPAAVVDQLKTLRDRIAKNPDDDVAITQLADMYLAAGFDAKAIPLYRRALAVNPHNVAAQTGLSEARESLRESNQ